MSDDENAELVHDWESDCYVLCDEITRLRAELAAVTEERDRLRIKLDKAHVFISGADWAQFFEEEHETARAALEGVKEPPR